MTNIRQALRAIAGGQSDILKICMVDAVDREARTADCTPIDDSAPILDCNLQSVQGSHEGVCIIPRVGSYVLVGLLVDGNAGTILLTDYVDAVYIGIADRSLEMTVDGININGGELGGMVKVEPLVARLNALEDELRNLKQAFTSWVPVPQDGGASLKADITPWAGTPVSQTSRRDLENALVKH